MAYGESSITSPNGDVIDDFMWPRKVKSWPQYV